MSNNSGCTLALTQQLVACASVTPKDAGCQTIISSRLSQLGFQCQILNFGEVQNLWAKRPSTHKNAPLFVFAGHTDVVPCGALDHWHTPPFYAHIGNDAYLYGRGVADMKTSLAAMVVSCEDFLVQHADCPFSIAFLITSDEEGPALNGSKKVCEWLQQQGEKLDFCLVGEPSSSNQLGDTIKNGRRGSLSGKLSIEGIQGHVAYPQFARNPIHELAKFLDEWINTQWDDGDEFFPPTSMQISNIHAGTGANNVIPGQCVLDFNFRFSPQSSSTTLQQRTQDLLKRHKLNYSLDWQLSGEPFLTSKGKLVQNLQQAIQIECQITAALATTGGTSDGRFIAKICPEVAEFGPVNATIHQVNERILIADIERLKNVYQQVLVQFLTNH